MDGGRVEWLVLQLVRRFLVDRSALETCSHASGSSGVGGVVGGGGCDSNGGPTGTLRVNAAFEYAMRIIGSRITPSLAADENGVVEAIKRRLVMERKTADAMAFADLHRKLASATGSGRLENRWALLHMLNAIAEDQRRGATSDSRGSAMPFCSTLSLAAARGGLPLLTVRSGSSLSTPTERSTPTSLSSSAAAGGKATTRRLDDHQRGVGGGGGGGLSTEEPFPLAAAPGGGGLAPSIRRPRPRLELPWDNDVISQRGDPSPPPAPPPPPPSSVGYPPVAHSVPILHPRSADYSFHLQQQQLLYQHPRMVAFRKYVEIRRSGFGVSEAALVRDVLYTCQGIDGRWIRWSEEADGYLLVVSSEVPIPPAVVTRVHKLCELGWLYRRVRAHVTENLETERGQIEAIGTVGQAFCAALQEELSEYYRLLAVLEAQAHNAIPLDGHIDDGARESVRNRGVGNNNSSSNGNNANSPSDNNSNNNNNNSNNDSNSACCNDNGHRSDDNDNFRSKSVNATANEKKKSDERASALSLGGAVHVDGAGGAGGGGGGINGAVVGMMGSGSGSGGAYLSLRRLAVWLAEPLRRMRLMAVLVDTCKNMKGGALAAAIHVHAQHGDPFVRAFMAQLLRRVCSPLFDMVKRWVLEGELDDSHGEFFVVADRSVRDEGLWRQCYRLHGKMLPPFIPGSLARRIFRTGKSINFLRRCCRDQGWEDAAAEAVAAVGKSVVGIGYGDTSALEKLVEEAAARIDLRLIKIMFEKFRFREHCLAIKRYLLLGQGDFIQYLMDLVGSELSLPAGKISAFKLTGLLESAIRASNAQYDDADVLDKLRVKMMAHVDGDKGWDVFSLEYVTTMPLSTIFTENVMKLYLRIFNFLWRLKRVEHALSATWQTMKPNAAVARGEPHSGSGRDVVSKARRALGGVLRRCQTLRSEMNHFVTNLQYYVMFEVLECSWADFLSEMEAAKDLDELIKAHEKFLQSIVEKALLGEQSQQLCRTLFSMFDLMLRFRGFADRLYERARDMQNRQDRAGRDTQRRSASSGLHGLAAEEAKAPADMEASESFLTAMGNDLDKIALEYTVLFDDFVAKLPLQRHTGLKFLSFRLDFSEYYSRRVILPQGEMSQLKLNR